MFMTEVMSLKTLASSAADPCQYGQEATSTPIAANAFEPQRANPDVIPHGLPARASVATFTAASPSAPAISGQGPRSHSARDGAALTGAMSPWRRRSILLVIIQAAASNASVRRQRPRHAQESLKRDRTRARRCGFPGRPVKRAQRGTGNEGSQRGHHADTAAPPHREQRTRRAAAAQLHADAEQERPRGHRQAQRPNIAAQFHAPELAIPQSTAGTPAP